MLLKKALLFSMCIELPLRLQKIKMKKIQAALISVFYKDGLEPIVKLLHQLGITIYSTGGTQTFIEKLGIPVVPVEQLTTYPSILGGLVIRVGDKVLDSSVAGRLEGLRQSLR